MVDPDGGLLRGTLDVLILKALTWGPRHGYAVAEWVKSVTDGELLVEEGPRSTASRRTAGSPASGATRTTIGARSTTSSPERAGRSSARRSAPGSVTSA